MVDENKFLNLGNFKDKILNIQNSGKLEKKDLGDNKNLLQIFNFFDKDGNGIIEVSNSNGVNEMASLWNTVKSSANKNGNSIFEDSEAQELLTTFVDEAGKSLADSQVTTSDMLGFLKTLINQPEAQNTSALKEEQCKEVTYQILDENLKEANEVFKSQHLGDISGAYDNAKEDNDILKTSNVAKVLGYQDAGLTQILKAKDGNLTKRQYYEENKQRIKDMVLTRLEILKTDTGVSCIDSYKGEYTREEIIRIIDNYIEKMCSESSMDDLKAIQLQFVSYNQSEEIEALSNLVDSAKVYNESMSSSFGVEGGGKAIKGLDKGIIPSYWDSDEAIGFEEVYKLERGTEYSQYNAEKYVQAKKEMETVINAYNKKQQFVDFTEALRKEELTFSEKEEKLLAGFADFYALSEDGGLSQLQTLIDKSKLPISLENGKFNLESLSDDESKIRALNQLLKLAGQEKEKEFAVFLGGKTLEEYQLAFEQAGNDILGEENGKLFAEAMVNDNMGMIKRYTSNTSMAGMGLTIVGGLLCITPAAPLGVAMVTAGNTLAIGGMVAKTGLGAADYATKEVQTQEELEGLTKDFIMDAGGFIVGMKAGQTGMKAFSKLIDQKLVAVFKQQIASGNRLQALKTVFTNPEYFKNFSKAAGAKISTDFLISYAGDLAMMGVLDTQDDWKSLLQANLTGILVGMSGDIKDIAGVGNVKVPTPEKVKVDVPKAEVPEVKVREPELKVENATKNDFEIENNDYKGFGVITLKSPEGEQLGNVNYAISEQNGKRVLKFEGLSSNQSGMNIGTTLIEELVKKSVELGAEGRLIAEASPSRGSGVDGRPMSNLGFYYKLGFRADDPAIDAKIQECINIGEEIPIALNMFTKISLTEEGIKAIVKANNASISSRLAVACSREEFTAIRDEIKAMPDGAEKTALQQQYLQRYNEWATDPARPDIRMQFKSDAGEVHIDKSSLRDKPVVEVTRNSIQEILKKHCSDQSYIKGFLEDIPDEYTATTILEYMTKYKDNPTFVTDLEDIAYQLANFSGAYQKFVEIIDSKEISDALKSPNNLLASKIFAGHTTTDALAEITKLGLDKPRKGCDNIDFDAISSIILIENPEQRALVAKLYYSKLFSRVRIDDLLTVEKVDLNKVSRFESMMDDFGETDNAHIYYIYELLKATNEQIDIIEARGLLKRQPGRSKCLGPSLIFTLAALDEQSWQKVLDRNLLGEINFSKNKKVFNQFEIEEYIKLTDREWNTFIDRGLIDIFSPDLKPHDIFEKLSSPECLAKLAKISDEDFDFLLSEYFLDDLESPLNKDLEYLDFSIREINGKITFDESTFIYASLFESYIKHRGFVGRLIDKLSNENGEINTEVAQELVELMEDMKTDGCINPMVAFMPMGRRARPDGLEVIYLGLKKSQVKKTTIEDVQAQRKIYEEMKGKLLLPYTTMVRIFQATDASTYDFLYRILTDNTLKLSDLTIGSFVNIVDLLINRDTKALNDSVELQLQKVLDAPYKYINGEIQESQVTDSVRKYFDENRGYLMIFSAFLDKEAFNHLLRMRFENVDDYIEIVQTFDSADIDLLAKMNQAVNQDSKPFMPTQKVEFIDLLQAYKKCGIDLASIEQMADAGKIDLGKLQADLLYKIMEKSGLSNAEIESVPKEKLFSWDIKFIHLLAKEINGSEDIAFNDILRAGTLEPDFMKYIHDSGNVYGQANAKTQAIFAEKGLNYEAWINPSKDAEMRFTSVDVNGEKLTQVSEQIIEDIETLRSGPVKGFIDKQFPHCIKDGKFVIPTEAMGSKVKLNEFVENIIKQLDSVWKRAEGNATNPDPKRSQMARGTLTVLDHLNQRIKDISAVSDEKITKNLDWTIKMWDRDPQKDIFQGNYSTCCIGMGGGNGSAMPHFVMNTAYNMIELVDNNTGKTVGNALCYLVTDESGKPAFIIDNIEINNGSKPSNEIGAQLRDMMAEYASRVSKDITGGENIPVYMSQSYNDVPVEDLASHSEKVSFVGDMDCDEIYMDLYDGWVSREDYTKECELLRLK